MTQEDLAHRTGWDRTYISDIERGIRNPSVRLLEDVATALGLHPALLLFEEQEAAMVRAALRDTPDRDPP